jgi:hypothetical protein
MITHRLHLLWVSWRSAFPRALLTFFHSLFSFFALTTDTFSVSLEYEEGNGWVSYSARLAQATVTLEILPDLHSDHNLNSFVHGESSLKTDPDRKY